jgi:hypothetical protein
LAFWGAAGRRGRSSAHGNREGGSVRLRPCGVALGGMGPCAVWVATSGRRAHERGPPAPVRPRQATRHPCPSCSTTCACWWTWRRPPSRSWTRGCGTSRREPGPRLLGCSHAQRGPWDGRVWGGAGGEGEGRGDAARARLGRRLTLAFACWVACAGHGHAAGAGEAAAGGGGGAAGAWEALALRGTALARPAPRSHECDHSHE